MILEKIEELEKSDKYNSWKKDHEKSYLVHAFRMLDDVNKNIWQIGYFNPENHKITVFVMDKEITQNPDAEVFQEQEKMVNKLDVFTVKIDADEALKKGEEILATEYKGATVFKSFMILQTIEEFGQVWNITFVTNQFKTINIKIDSNSGEVKIHKEVSLIQE